MDIDDTPHTVFESTFDYSESDISINFSQNTTEVLCCINGPAELPQVKRINDKLAVNLLYYLENGASTSSTELQSFANLMIDQAKYPRAGVSINIHQLKDNGSRISTALNALSLSLLDSAIPFDNLFAAVDVALLPNSSVIVNPTKAVESKAVGTAVIIFCLKDKMLEVYGFKSRGLITPDFYCGAVEAAKPAASEVFAYFRSSMEERLRLTSTL